MIRTSLYRSWLQAAACIVGVLSLATAHAVPATNGILSIDYDEIGRFSVSTGSRHPVPNETVFFGTGTSYISVRDAARKQVFVNFDYVPLDSQGDSAFAMGQGTTQSIGSRGFRTTWVLPNFTVVQEVEIDGATLADTNVRHEVAVISRP